MYKKKPNPDGFRAWVKKRTRVQPDRVSIGDNMRLAKLANRHGISSELARSILREEGWELRPTPSGILKRWLPPAEEG